MYNSIQYLGVELVTERPVGLPNETDDMNFRLKMVEDMLNKVQQSGNISLDKECLKIMVFPEFLFRGSIGAYSMENTLKIVEKLRELVNKPRFKDWLFVFGTIVGYSKNEINNEVPYETYNFSFIQEGNKGEENSYIVLKKHRSPIDFAQGHKRKYINESNTEYLKPIKRRNLRGEQKVLNYDGNCIFNVGGLKIGVEICLDNLENRISPLEKHNKNLDVHIVTACGIEMEDLRNYGKLQKNGVFLFCDGIDGTVKIGVNLKREMPNQTIIRYNPEDKKIFKGLFLKSYTNMYIFEPTKVLNLTKEKGLDMSKI